MCAPGLDNDVLDVLLISFSWGGLEGMGSVSLIFSFIAFCCW